jgi:PKD repeat protein
VSYDARTLGANNPPVANDDSASTPENTPVTIDVAANDTDVDGNLNPGSTNTDCTGCSTTTNGPLVNHSDGTFTYNPAASFNGSDEFVYQICDSDSDCDTATVSITVTPQNNPPVANDLSDTTSEETEDTWYPDISDVDDNTFTCEVANPSTNGATVSVAPDCYSGSYLPSLDFNGADSFIYTVCDQGGLCDSGTVTYDVIAVNDYPVAADVSGSTAEETQDTWYPLVNDVDDPSFTCAILFTPSNGGTAGVDQNCNSGLYTPPPNYYGTDSFTYQACDLGGLCDTGLVTYTITATSMHVGDLDANPESAPRNRWSAIVSIKVHDALGSPVANVDVDGSWSAGTSGYGICTTNSSGECSVTKNNIKGNITRVTFTVDNLAHSTLNYKPSANHDPDPDSLGTTIVVYKESTPTNQPPTASFTYQCTDLSCEFDASGSSDTDGTITNFDWTFGDGNSGSEVMSNHTYAAEGSYSVVLIVTDNDGLTSSDTQQVNLGPAVTQEFHVGDIDGSTSSGKRGRWNATAVVTIHSESETMVEGATVTGTWSNGRVMSCTTDVNGSCSFTLSNIKSQIASISFTVTSVTATGWEYNSNSNHDDESDSNGTSITIEP